MNKKLFTWPNTAITEFLSITLPIIQAPMAGGATTPELVAAVANAGGLGSLAAGYMAPEEIKEAIQKIHLLTNKPFAVNLFVPEEQRAVTAEQITQAQKIIEAACVELNWHATTVKPPYAPSFDAQMTILLEEKIPIFSFTFGIPTKDWLTEFKANGILLIGSATTLAEAKQLEAQGVDIIVAQGSEAGGHRGTFIGPAEEALHNILSLIPLLVTNVNIPVIAAGGIMDAKGIIAVLTLGAAGVQMGTAFLSCPEAGIHPQYKEALLTMQHDNTTLTRAFSGKLARGITNKFITRMQSQQKYILDYPIQNALTSAMRKTAAQQHCIDFMSMWAGQAAYLSKRLPAAQLIQLLHDEISHN
jgi:nitronate monooxygenase